MGRIIRYGELDDTSGGRAIKLERLTCPDCG